MPLEIERKFLIADPNWLQELIRDKYYTEVHTIKQGYLINTPELITRIRLSSTRKANNMSQYEDKAYITIKGKTVGISKPEYEYEIPFEDAKELLQIKDDIKSILKHRYVFNFDGFIWEIDQFMGDNNGLVVAEIELPKENTVFEKPSFIGTEVTHDHKFSNNNLIDNPFDKWPPFSNILSLYNTEYRAEENKRYIHHRGSK